MSPLAYRVAAHRKSTLAPALLTAAGLVILGCSAGVKPTPTGTAGTGGGFGPGLGGTQGSAGSTGGGPPIGGFSGSGSGTGGGCQHTEYTFEPKIPTVYLVVDRSGSMFHCLSSSEPVCANKADTAWSKLKDAIQIVLTQLDAQVRFGFTTIYGTNPTAGGSCPLATTGALADNVPPALDNAAAIKTLYDGLTWPLVNDSSTPGKKFESPASYALAATTKALTAVTVPGDKYMIFITDGQEDYCDDALHTCASDSTVWALQKAFAANIRTIVFGLQTAEFNLPAGVLPAFANAGAGEATLPPVTAGQDMFAFWDQCNGVAPWSADLTASGKPNMRGSALGTYSTTAGPTKPFMPSATDQTMLVTQLSAALAGVKSCVFDLTATGGASIKVNLNQLNKASVAIQGTTVPLDPNSANGWNMINESTLQLFGSACDTWHNPNNTNIAFDFPCDIIID
jgi:hypothetical protein